MNQEQKDRILSVIDRDAAIRERYINTKGETCVIGGLAEEIGIDLWCLYRTHNNPARIQSLWFCQDLQKEFGLTVGELERLQNCNDHNSIRKIRKEKLRDLVNSWEVS